MPEPSPESVAAISLRAVAAAEGMHVRGGARPARVREEEVPDVERLGAFELDLDVREAGVLAEDGLRHRVREGELVGPEEDLDDGRGRVLLEDDEVPEVRHEGRGRPARGRRDVDDDERLGRREAPPDVDERARAEERVVQRDERMRRRGRDERLLDALGREPQDGREVLEQDLRRERLGGPPHEPAVHEDEARARGGEAERPEPRLELHGLRALGDRDVARGEAEDRARERQEVRVAPRPRRGGKGSRPSGTRRARPAGAA